MPSLLDMYHHPALLVSSSATQQPTWPWRANQSSKDDGKGGDNAKSCQSYGDEEEDRDSSTADERSHVSDSDSSIDWVSDIASNSKKNIRSRVKGRNSPSTGSNDDSLLLPLVRSDSSYDSDDSSQPSRASNSAKGVPTPKKGLGVYQVLQWVVVATLLSFMSYKSVAVALAIQYYPTHGVTNYPNGLMPYISKPIFDYDESGRPDLPSVTPPVHIPRIVHVTYKSLEELPPAWKDSLQQWKETHPDWEIRFWSDKDLAEFVHNEYPEMEEFWKSYKYFIQRVDSVRYMILKKYGGIYSDLDIYPATSLDKLLQQWEDAGKNVLLAESLNMGVTNAFMAAAPESEFMKCVVENLPNYQHLFTHVAHWQHWEILSSAGSTYLWGMVGHCQDDQVEIMDALSFRGCSACESYKTGQPSETCDTMWLHHSATNSSWHQAKTVVWHRLWIFVSYTLLCSPLRGNFLVVSTILLLVRLYRSRKSSSCAKSLER